MGAIMRGAEGGTPRACARVRLVPLAIDQTSRWRPLSSKMTVQPGWETTQDLVYVLDDALELVWFNDSWRRFAAENNGDRLLEPGRRLNALESMSGGHRVRWHALYRALLSGQLPEYRERFACPSPTMRRTYALEVIRSDAPGGEGALLVHRARLVEESPAPGVEYDQQAEYDDRARPRSDQGREPIRASAFCRPLDGVGGDVVWSHRDPAGRAWFLIGDAMGHDADAAQAALRVRQLVEDHLGARPAETLDIVNRVFVREHLGRPSIMFVTGILFLIDLDMHEVRVCAFGHHGFLATAAGLVEIEGGMPIGVLEEPDAWPEQVLDTRDLGQRTLAFTDGIIEQFNEAGEMYTIERVATKFLETMKVPLTDSIREIVQSVDRFRGAAAVKDDQTILGFELEL